MDFTNPVRNFRLPAYPEIPDVGLYLEQTVKYINSFFAPFPGMELTSSMVSNYVKKGLVANPVKKQYSRKQIAVLLCITAMKVVLSIDNIHLMLRLQQETYAVDVAYEYFRCELDNVLAAVFGLKDSPDSIGSQQSEQKIMLRNVIVTVAHKMYLDQYCAGLRQKYRQKDEIQPAGAARSEE